MYLLSLYALLINQSYSVTGPLSYLFWTLKYLSSSSVCMQQWHMLYHLSYIYVMSFVIFWPTSWWILCSPQRYRSILLSEEPDNMTGFYLCSLCVHRRDISVNGYIAPPKADLEINPNCCPSVCLIILLVSGMHYAHNIVYLIYYSCIPCDCVWSEHDGITVFCVTFKLTIWMVD